MRISKVCELILRRKLIVLLWSLLVVTMTFGAWASARFAENRTKYVQAHSDLSDLEVDLERYKSDYGEYPRSLEVLFANAPKWIKESFEG